MKFILGQPQGELENLIVEESGNKRVTGIRTRDGLSHLADLVVVACECGSLGHEWYEDTDNHPQAVLGHHLLFRKPIAPSKPQWEPLCLSIFRVTDKISERGFIQTTSLSGGFWRARETSKC